jgi:hypothetical protein
MNQSDAIDTAVIRLGNIKDHLEFFTADVRSGQYAEASTYIDEIIAVSNSMPDEWPFVEYVDRKVGQVSDCFDQKQMRMSVTHAFNLIDALAALCKGIEWAKKNLDSQDDSL